MRKSFKYRAYCNKTTASRAERWLSLCQTLYNLALEQRIYAWRRRQKSLSFYDQNKQLKELKEAFPEFREVGSQVLENVLRRLDLAYQAFFRRIKVGKTPGFPRFKGRDRYDSFTLRQHGWKVDGQYLIIQKIGKFKLKLSRPVQGNTKTITVRRINDKWYVCFFCEEVPERLLPKTGKATGMDVGLKSFATLSSGKHVNNPRFAKKAQTILKNRQQKLSRCKRGSNRRRKVKELVRKAYGHVANQRRDFHFKTALSLVQAYDMICIEDMKAWVTHKSLNCSMRDAAWFNFFEILVFKAEEAGKQVVKVPAKYTSQRCSSCGVLVWKSLSVRTHSCPCGLVLDRDHNAALNILKAGQALRCCASH